MISMESAHPKLYKRCRDATEYDLENRLFSFDINRRLHPNQYKDVCSCSDCHRKITRLQGFEKNILFLSELKSRHFRIWQDVIEDLYYKMYYNACDTIFVYESIRISLKSVCEDGGLSFTLPKSNAAYKFDIAYNQITQLLLSADLFHKPPEGLDTDHTRRFHLSQSIGSLMYDYTFFKANKEAAPLLKQILEIEQNNIAERMKSIPDFSLLKVNIEKQIEQFEMLPVELLVQEVKDLIELISPIPMRDHYTMFRGVCNYINDIDAAISMERDKFWANNSNLVNGHSSNGLDKTLDFLIEKADSFDKKWETEFASFYTSFYNNYLPSVSFCITLFHYPWTLGNE